MDKSIISMWGVPQCLKEIKERKVLKEVANAKWMQLICFICPIVAILLSSPTPIHNTTSTSSSYEQKTQHNSADDVICGSAEMPPLCCTQLYHCGKQKKEKGTPPFKDKYQRYLESLNSSSWAERCSPPLQVYPTYHCLQAGGGRSLIGLHFKHISYILQ